MEMFGPKTMEEVEVVPPTLATTTSSIVTPTEKKNAKLVTSAKKLAPTKPSVWLKVLLG